MLVWLSVPAFAATVDVCSTCTYTTVQRGVSAAGTGGTVRVAAGTYDESITIDRDVTVIGAGSEVTFLRNSTSDPIIYAGHTPDYGPDLTVEISGFTLEPPSANGVVLLNTTATLSDIRAEGFSGKAVWLYRNGLDPISLSVDGCAFVDNGIGIEVWSGTHHDVTVNVSESTFSGHLESALSIGAGAAVEVADCVFEQNTGTQGGAILAVAEDEIVLAGNTFSGNTAVHGGAVYAAMGSAAFIERNRFCGNEADIGGAVYGGIHVMASGNIFVDNSATGAGGDVYLTTGSLLNNTFIGAYAPAGGTIWSDWGYTDFRNNIVADTSDYGLYGNSSTGSPTISYNDFWEVAPDAVGGTWPPADSTNFAVDPMFVSYVEGGCEELDLGLLPGSPLYDAGDPSTTDADGTVADVGATGGSTPAEGTRRWYGDADGDGYGGLDDVAYGATLPTGYIPLGGDCDDRDVSVSPAVAEICDGIDQDCDGKADDAVTTIWRLDADGDGYQAPESVEACEAPEGWTKMSGSADCDDGDPTVNPGTVEICDGIDQDCDGYVDDGVMTTWRLDADGDGYQAPESIEACEAPEGWTKKSGSADCDDADPAVNPGAAEICDGIDQDCDGKVDDGVMTTWRPDADGDGFQSAESVDACESPDGWLEDAGGPYDCDDGDPDVFPGAAEVVEDGIDQDCDGEDAESIEPADTDADVDTEIEERGTVGGGCKGCDSGGGPSWALLAGLLALGSTRRRAPLSRKCLR